MIKPYKLKATYMLAYVNLLGGLGMIIGEQMMIIPLAIVHLLMTFMKNNYMATQAAANQATYDNQKRLFMADIVIFFALLMILFDKILKIVYFVNIFVISNPIIVVYNDLLIFWTILFGCNQTLLLNRFL